ncbi:helix-turn-helix domain-containing protein [Fodinisporobacter ferrooxydans]|uniref:Helix-turn-helix domain-containing protein n=1 Tax=Fodinisporobacter ferrooxydans TaxID=2901836 RepID=A0ABY4CNK5_9BACL|nr:helix-turn-helix domain-containing protein [Alicyclobacillaceae bacterium MYW30-H2]
MKLGTHIAERLQELMDERKISFEDLVQLAGIDKLWLRECTESGQLTNLNDVVKICKAFDVPLAYFVGEQVVEYGNGETNDALGYDLQGDQAPVALPVYRRFFANEQILTEENQCDEEWIAPGMKGEAQFITIADFTLTLPSEKEIHPGNRLLWACKRWPEHDGQIVATVYEEEAILGVLYQAEDCEQVVLKSIDDGQDLVLWPDEVVIIAICVGMIVEDE